MPHRLLLHRWHANQLWKVNLQPARGSGDAGGVQILPPELCHQGNRRHLCSRLRVHRGLLQSPVSKWYGQQMHSMSYRL
jgi:hypothetical protein